MGLKFWAVRQREKVRHEIHNLFEPCIKENMIINKKHLDSTSIPNLNPISITWNYNMYICPSKATSHKKLSRHNNPPSIEKRSPVLIASWWAHVKYIMVIEQYKNVSTENLPSYSLKL